MVLVPVLEHTWSRLLCSTQKRATNWSLVVFNPSIYGRSPILSPVQVCKPIGGSQRRRDCCDLGDWTSSWMSRVGRSRKLFVSYGAGWYDEGIVGYGRVGCFSTSTVYFFVYIYISYTISNYMMIPRRLRLDLKRVSVRGKCWAGLEKYGWWKSGVHHLGCVKPCN